MIDFQTQVTHDGIAIVRLQGWLDQASSRYFFDCMDDMIDEGNPNIVIDCHGLGLMSSLGFGRLLRARQMANSRNGRITLANVNTSISQSIQVLGLTRLLGVFPNLDLALSNVRRATTDNHSSQVEMASR